MDAKNHCNANSIGALHQTTVLQVQWQTRCTDGAGERERWRVRARGPVIFSLGQTAEGHCAIEGSFCLKYAECHQSYLQE